MLSIVRIASNAHEISIVETEVKITKIMVSNPRRIGEIVVKMTVKGQNEYSDKQNALTCPVYLTRSDEVKKTVSLFVLEFYPNHKKVLTI